MSDMDDPVQRYQQVMRQMLEGRKLAEWSDDDDGRHVELLDEIWWKLSEAEQQHVDEWVRSEIRESTAKADSADEQIKRYRQRLRNLDVERQLGLSEHDKDALLAELDGIWADLSEADRQRLDEQIKAEDELDKLCGRFVNPGPH